MIMIPRSFDVYWGNFESFRGIAESVVVGTIVNILARNKIQ